LAVPLLERDVELADLRARLRALVDDGAGGVVLVEGPAGIGKSVLIDAALRDARGVTVLRARGAELEGGLSFGTVRELFGVALMQIKKAEREALFDGPAALARPVLGFAAEGVPAGDPLYGLLWFAAGLAERTPLVVAIDDVHWIDEESGRFAAYLAERLEGLPILLLAGARPAEPGAEPGPAAALAQVGTVMRLQPLSENGIAQLVPGGPTAELRRATGGNPLLILELSRGSVATDARGGAVLDRVAAVSEDALALARAISLSAEPIRLGDAAALAALDEGAAVALADALIRAEVLASDEHGRLAFSHPLQRTEVYESLAPFERRLAHRHAARLLADRGADIRRGDPRGCARSGRRILRSSRMW
jgi:hypothetical protein